MNTAKARSKMSEHERILAACKGDQKAFAEIYEQHADRVLALITRILGPSNSYEDVLQEAFVELHRALPTFRKESRLSTFVYRIAVRTALRHVGRNREQRKAFGDEQLERCVAPGRSPAECVDDLRALRRTFSVMSELKPARRVAFILAAVEGLSYDEVGEVLGISPDAAKQRTLRARQDLKKILAKSERKRSRA